MPSSNGKVVSALPRHGLLPATFALFSVAIVVLIPLLARQPKEVSAAVYSAYVSIMALAAAVTFKKKGRRGAAIVAALVCASFMTVFVVYVVLAFRAST